jgi:hypothetical protein
MTYQPYFANNLTDNIKEKFDFKKLFSNEDWHNLPNHAQNLIINLGHKINRNHFYNMYRTNKEEPARVADIYKRQKTYFYYVIEQLEYFIKYESKDKIKKSYRKIIDLVKNRKKLVLKAKPKIIKEKFTSTLIGNDNMMVIILMILLVWIM